MDINDYIGYKLFCKMSTSLKDESYYTENEFTVEFKKDDNDESGFVAVIEGIDQEGNDFLDNRDAEEVFKHILFGNWDMKKKVKLS